MRVDFPEIAEGSRLNLHISSGAKSVELGATITKHLKKYIALVELDNMDGRAVKFENVTVNAIYTNENGIPYIWFHCKIVYYQKQYLLQVSPDGGRRYNRRSSFRVGVSYPAMIHIDGHGFQEVMVRDLSLSGFSITDRRRCLSLSKGSTASISFEDLGQQIELTGRVVRVEDHEDHMIYAFVITKSSRDLSTYVSLKQRLKRH